MLAHEGLTISRNLLSILLFIYFNFNYIAILYEVVHPVIPIN